jgi:molecular chaperone GrpE
MTSQDAAASAGRREARDTAVDDLEATATARRAHAGERPGESPADAPPQSDADGDDGRERAGDVARAEAHAGISEQDGDDMPADSGVDGETGAAGDVDVETVIAERDEYLDALRRMQAEFDNFRKRTARQQSETFDRAVETVVERLLPALDALDLALAHVGSAGSGELEPAFVQIGSLLRDILAKEGLERIDADGVAFDPTVHDAVAHVPADEGQPEQDGASEAGPAEPAVVETLRAGYRLKGRVLRPAMVKVRA